MKFILNIICLLFIYTANFAQQGKIIAVHGNISGLPEGSRVWVLNFEEPSDTIAEASVANNHFQLKGSIPEPDIYRIVFEESLELRAFLGYDTLLLEGDVDQPEGILFTGSATHKDYAEFDAEFLPIYGKLSRISRELKSKKISNINDPLAKEYFATIEEAKTRLKEFITARPHSPVSAFAIYVTGNIEEDPYKTQENLQLLHPEIQKSGYGRIVQENIRESLIGRVGTEIIPFQQADTSGKMVSSEEFKGKYVLIDFWASWCGPCRAENPNVVNAYHKFKDKNFTVLGISLDQHRDKWLNAIAADKLTWQHVSDLKFWDNEVARMYRISSIPQNLLVGPNGLIIAKNLRGPVLQAKLCELLGCEN